MYVLDVGVCQYRVLGAYFDGAERSGGGGVKCAGDVGDVWGDGGYGEQSEYIYHGGTDDAL